MIISDMIDFIKGIYTAQRQPMFPQNKCYLLYMQVYVREHEICNKSTHNLIFFNIWCFL